MTIILWLCVCMIHIHFVKEAIFSDHFCAFITVSPTAVHHNCPPPELFVQAKLNSSPMLSTNSNSSPAPGTHPSTLCFISWIDWDVSSKGNHHSFFLSAWIPVFHRPSTILYSQQLHRPIPMSFQAFQPSGFGAAPTSWGEDLLYEIGIKC